ncbi:Sporulation inhibitor A [Alteribacillus persepolensis]|uniref:Sporulation inhibitor A n=2 Tax=Alteribacillus persepolensis TaxID=568899 RepID=A0A1G8JLR3_9BACI|nr:Sporulation inhibitor A [Alteribacillus persepolensis]
MIYSFISPWMYVSNDLLVTLYRKAIEQQYDKELIEYVFDEIKRRLLDCRRNHMLSNLIPRLINSNKNVTKIALKLKRHLFLKYLTR